MNNNTNFHRLGEPDKRTKVLALVNGNFIRLTWTGKYLADIGYDTKICDNFQEAFALANA